MSARSATVILMSTDPHLVWLVYSSNVDEGQLIDRSGLPDEAERFALEFHPAKLGMPDDGEYEVWVVDDATDVRS
ncbi:hypothetical protein CH252_31065 [Rhodococcus sp. 06-1477-1B]|nr:hypothetical protein CH252_31065 [Rhodococcus sp. 06-1477-1B]